MGIILDIDKEKQLIQKSIKKYGFLPEHNYHYYKYLQTGSRKNIFFSFEKNMGIMARCMQKTNIWSMISEPLAPKQKRIEVLFRAIDYVLGKAKGKKFHVELAKEPMNEVLAYLKTSKKYRACPVNYILYWPVFDMRKWDGDKLKGKIWKKIRNIRNNFYRHHRLRARHPACFSREQLKEIVINWVRRRNGLDKANYQFYYNLIDNNFEGTDFARTLVIDGKPSTIAAGWRIPNSNNYYSDTGVYNYMSSYIGEISYLDELRQLKRAGYGFADFGGSDRAMLTFKKKFKPSYIYKTYAFSIVRKKK